MGSQRLVVGGTFSGQGKWGPTGNNAGTTVLTHLHK